MLEQWERLQVRRSETRQENCPTWKRLSTSEARLLSRWLKSSPLTNRGIRTYGSNRSRGLWFFKDNQTRVSCRVSREAQLSEPKPRTHNKLGRQLTFRERILYIHIYFFLFIYVYIISSLVHAIVSLACYRRCVPTVATWTPQRAAMGIIKMEYK